MPRRPDTPCSACGKLCWPTPNSRAGRGLICNECRTQHGTLRRYKKGCRCVECRAANAVACREYAASYRERHGRPAHSRYRPIDKRHWINPNVRLEVYERDGWICQLCVEPVDPTLDPNDRMAATLDHIECQSWALIPDNSPANLRLAHRACNSRRRDGYGREEEVA